MGLLGRKDRTRQRQKRRKFLNSGCATLLTAMGFSAAARAQRPPSRPEADRSATSIGPDNHLLDSLNPSSASPPATDEGETPAFWYSFALAPRRLFAGGWYRHVNAQDFPIAREIAAMNLRLSAGGVRGQHWNSAAEWGFVLSGNVRLTAIDLEGKSYRKDLAANDIWYLPAGTPHSLQGLGPDGCAALMVFDSGTFSESSASELSDWLRHTPRDIVAKNLGLAEADLESLYKPQHPLPISQAALDPPSTVSGLPRASTNAFDIALNSIPPARKSVSAELKIVDSAKLPAATSIVAAHVVVKPGGLREMHWHPDADEWQYFLQGQGRMTVFFNAGRARTADFNAGDIGYVPKALGHYVQNTGPTDLIFLEILRASRFREMSLSEWIRNTPPELVIQNLGISRETLNAILKQQP